MGASLAFVHYYISCREANIIQHCLIGHVALVWPPCRMMLEVVDRRKSSSTSSNVSFVLRCEQKCCISLAITSKCCTRACAAAIGIYVDGLFYQIPVTSLPVNTRCTRAAVDNHQYTLRSRGVQNYCGLRVFILFICPYYYR